MQNRYRLAASFMLVTSAVISPAQATETTQHDNARDQLQITDLADRATRTDLSDYFTGRALVNPLFTAEDDSNTTAAEVIFEPAARTNWHVHPVGQQLVITQGIGRVQIEGRPARRMRAGDVVWIPAGVRHWHGASPDHSMTHIAIQERRDGQNVEWGDAVSEAQYNAE
ncbi:cupin domain-containing protein [Salinisphaera sp. T5B8]|uniref:(R)-mandelonitrile lyase n=1 Tax=Salinisphaera sp. T5B8 TaxID=1304154 RepID=UPI00333ECA62